MKTIQEQMCEFCTLIKSLKTVLMKFVYAMKLRNKVLPPYTSNPLRSLRRIFIIKKNYFISKEGKLIKIWHI